LYSMSGFGRAGMAQDGREISVEIRSVNHRFLDINLRLPGALTFLEKDVRGKVSERFKRGHMDITFTYRNMRSDAHTVRVNVPLAHHYAEALKLLPHEIGIKDDLGVSHLIALSDVVTLEQSVEDEETLSRLALSSLGTALEGVLRMRETEGKRLLSNLQEILGRVEEKVKGIERIADTMPLRCRETLVQRLKALALENVDEGRLAQEAAFLADRCDITEELTRLDSHIAQMREAFHSEGETGRRLDFLVQELNREINTISSKATDAHVVTLAVDIKSDIEKLREQIQNVE